jgi:1-acyl-sn-glycerol-3-phosphate acyltransferase
MMISRLRMSNRLFFVGVHIAYGLTIVVSIFPLVSPQTRCTFQQNWSRRLLHILGVRLEVTGPPVAGNFLLANHISWLDIFVINAIAQATFVSKSEVRDWPLIGLLCARTGTIFIERGSRSAAMRVNQTLVEKLSQGEQIAVFPEGTTSEGTAPLPFRAALLQSAIEAGSAIQPLALRYIDDQGRNATGFAYCGETTFWQSLCAIAATHGVSANIDILEQIAAGEMTRKELAELSHSKIKNCLMHNNSGAPLAYRHAQECRHAMIEDPCTKSSEA